MKLYELPRNTWFKIAESQLSFFFHHIDGMYSLITTENGEVTHFAAWTEVEQCSKSEQKRLNAQHPQNQDVG
jgi:hypothetical protein